MGFDPFLQPQITTTISPVSMGHVRRLQAVMSNSPGSCVVVVAGGAVWVNFGFSSGLGTTSWNPLAMGRSKILSRYGRQKFKTLVPMSIPFASSSKSVTSSGITDNGIGICWPLIRSLIFDSPAELQCLAPSG
ncbi:uncharacterized protein Z519_04148 [Cladophialophora bantiana CBS 173.52]|uniref:Uncharacterized protein n=1 Tax=Cladophialophora bantiana (strain ATCC 10958 / CBS 173.52 / CDC B-1940 / NIH 8579) TaxID=1442370 RepID=A0A0D2HQ62_CLAB1|nr:uncharacterized protein Z519_04148 [Cladophialophora bantiana CBS 173.52]KIW95563.1 hypothetical protein Z519_04148 [Cladophialophora bantiana CBS 173.52]